MLPSIKSLGAVFGDHAQQARKVLELSYNDLVGYRVAHRIITTDLDLYYHRPTLRHLRLDTLNHLAGTHGVESFLLTRRNGAERYLTYLNAGDTYTPTLIVWNDQYQVTDWGTKLEVLERQGWHA